MAFTTRKSLLERVRSQDEVSWREFYETYKPLIILCGQDCNLTYEEIEELIQKVMCEIFEKDIVGKYNLDQVPDNVVFTYDPAKGRFRHYLRKIIRNQAIKIFNRRSTNPSLDDPDAPPLAAVTAEWDNTWDAEWQKHIFNMALAELKTHVKTITYLAFEMYAIQNRPVTEVAEFLNLSVDSVYVAKNRCVRALKSIIRNLEE